MIPQAILRAIALLIAVTTICWQSKGQDGLGSFVHWQRTDSISASTAGRMSLGVAGPVTGVLNNMLFIAGGANFPNSMPWEGGSKQYYQKGYLWNRGKGNQLTLASSFDLPEPIAYAATAHTATGLVYAGGENERKLSSACWLVEWNETGTQVVFEALPDLPEPLTNASMVVMQDQIWVLGGENSYGTSDRVYSLSINHADSGWKIETLLPLPLTHMVAVVQSNGAYECLYVIGGRSKTTSLISRISDQVWQYDLKRKSWVPVGNLPHPLAAGTGVPSGTSYILLIGGDEGILYNETERLMLRADTTTDLLRKKELLAAKAKLQSHHPGFSRDIYLFNTVTKVWAKVESFPFASQVTTRAFYWNNEIIIPSGEVGPGRRTPYIIRGLLQSNQRFHWQDYAVLFTYLLAMVGIGVWAARRQTDTDAYFRGGQKIPGWAAGLSIYGTQLSAITFMSIPAKTYASNWNYFILQMTILLCLPFIARYYIPFFRKLKITSAYEYLENRFDYSIRAMASLLFIALQVGRLAIVMLLPSLALTVVTGMDVMLCVLLMGLITIFYTMKGGIEAVIWTDVVQVVILLGGALLCIAILIGSLNFSGESVWQTLQQENKLEIFDFRFNWQEPTFWVVLAGGFAIHMISYGADQTTVQRYLTTRNEKSAKKSLKLGVWMVVPSTLLFFSLGTLLYLFYRQHPEKANYTLPSLDGIFPWYIVSQLPAGISGLLIAAIFSAAMSTLSSSLNSVSAALVTDFYRRFRKEKSEAHYLRQAQIYTAVIGLLGTAIALLMARQGIHSLWDQFNTILGLFTGGLGAVFVLGIFVKRAHARGVALGLILSAVAQWMFSQYTTINFLLYAFTGLATCVICGYLFSLLIPAPASKMKEVNV